MRIFFLASLPGSLSPFGVPPVPSHSMKTRKPNKARYVKVKKKDGLISIGGIEVANLPTVDKVIKVSTLKVLPSDIQGTSFYNASDGHFYYHTDKPDIQVVIVRTMKPNSGGYCVVKDTDGLQSIDGSPIGSFATLSFTAKFESKPTIGELDGQNFYNAKDDSYYVKALSDAPVNLVYLLVRKLKPNKCGYCIISPSDRYPHANIVSINDAPFYAGSYTRYPEPTSCRKRKPYGIYNLDQHQGESFTAQTKYWIYNPAGITVKYQEPTV